VKESDGRTRASSSPPPPTDRCNLQQFSTKSTRACFRTAHCHIFFSKQRFEYFPYPYSCHCHLVGGVFTKRTDRLSDVSFNRSVTLRKFDVSIVSTCEIRSFNGRSILLMNLVSAGYQTFSTVFCVQLTSVIAIKHPTLSAGNSMPLMIFFVIIWHFPKWRISERLSPTKQKTRRIPLRATVKGERKKSS
jgi:hypothetical protein